MRRVDNPPNPYLSEHREYLGPPPAARLDVYEERARSIIAGNDSPDVPFCWSVNPYRGCQHACAYCYARRTHEYFGHGAGTDFDTRVIVKVNAAELLERELSRPTWEGEPLAFSGVTDCYQPLEAVYGVTRACLEVCLRRANPVGVVTKSHLIARDADLLAALHRRAGVRVYFSIPFFDAEVARKLQPHTPPPERQFEALRRLAAAGVPVGIMVAPIIPGLNDHDIPALLQRAAECGARGGSYSPIRLPGSVKDVFLSRLRAELPEAAARVEQRILELHGGRWNDPRFGCRMRGTGAYWESVKRLFQTMVLRYGLNRRAARKKSADNQPLLPFPPASPPLPGSASAPLCAGD